jgi:hypothetical protein
MKLPRQHRPNCCIPAATPYASQRCVEDRENPWTRCSLTSPEDLLKGVDFDSQEQLAVSIQEQTDRRQNREETRQIRHTEIEERTSRRETPRQSTQKRSEEKRRDQGRRSRKIQDWCSEVTSNIHVTYSGQVQPTLYIRSHSGIKDTKHSTFGVQKWQVTYTWRKAVKYRQHYT